MKRPDPDIYYLLKGSKQSVHPYVLDMHDYADACEGLIRECKTAFEYCAQFDYGSETKRKVAEALKKIEAFEGEEK